jgi:hypothetical protein
VRSLCHPRFYRAAVPHALLALELNNSLLFHTEITAGFDRATSPQTHLGESVVAAPNPV